MRQLVMGLLLLGFWGADLPAAVSEFPYEAMVDADNVYARSGPGRSYYPTNRLKRGSRVTVRRHDPGGWLMITPPPDSFSWIRAEYVRVVGSGRGIVRANDVVVRVGSTFGNDRDIKQRELSKGDEVKIIQEATLSSERGPTRMYKIRPPQGEYRWVRGGFITPASEIAAQQQQQVIPQRQSNQQNQGFSNSQQRPTAEPRGSGDGFVERKVNRTIKSDAVRRTGPTAQQISADRSRLKQLDVRFRDIIDEEARSWNFAALETEYLNLAKEVQSPAMQSQIKLRLDAVERYRKIKAEYDDFLHLTSDTNRREKSLLAIQQKQKSDPTPTTPTTAPATSEPSSTTPTTGPVTSQPSTTIVTPPTAGQPATQPTAPGSTNPPPVPPRNPSQTIVPGPAGQPQPGQRMRPFDGAGIIQRAGTNAPGLPRHVLIAPNGRFLAFLQGGPGVNLDRFVGRPMGLYGARSHRADMRADFIVVHRMMPVRLQP